MKIFFVSFIGKFHPRNLVIVSIFSAAMAACFPEFALAQRCDFILCGQGHRQYCEPQCRGVAPRSDPVDDAFGRAFTCILMPQLCAQPRNPAPQSPRVQGPSRAENPRLPSFHLPANQRWIVVAGSRDRNEAIRRGREFGSRYMMTQVFVMRSGFHAVVIGIETTAQAQVIVSRLRREGKIPADSFLSRGEDYVDRIWATDRLLQHERRR